MPVPVPTRRPRNPRPLSRVRSLLGFPPETQVEAEEWAIWRTRRFTTFIPSNPPSPEDLTFDLPPMNTSASKTLGRGKLPNAKPIPSPLTISPDGPTTSLNSPSSSSLVNGPPSPATVSRFRSGSLLKKVVKGKGSLASLLSSQSHLCDKSSAADAGSVSTTTSSLSSSSASKRSMKSSTSSLRLSWEEQPRQEIKAHPEPQKFKRKNGVDFHPYDVRDAPYMQPYNYMAFENDHYTHRLLQMVLPEGSPTFHHYGDHPPRNVLDLGCGQGEWVVQAATSWVGTKVTGLDLVDVFSGKWQLDEVVAENISWVRHNFVTNALPFPDNSFDLVRLAGFNLSLPWHQLTVIFAEIQRVLARDGRLEVVYDEMIFPYVEPASPVKSTFTDVPPCAKRPDSDIDSDDDKVGGHTSTPSKPKAGSGAALAAARSPFEDHDLFVKNSEDLETLFCSMLCRVYRIACNMNDALFELLLHSFGVQNAQRRRTVRVCLPSRSFMARSQIERPQDQQREGGLIKIDWETREEKANQARSRAVEATLGNLPPAGLPGSLSKKAAAMLGATSLSPAGPTYQQEGLVVYPDRFIPMSPAEIEMHACKFLHLLVNCGEAMGQYVKGFKGDDGNNVVTQEEFNDSLWDYEMFRRRRFNWPTDTPELRLKEQFLPEPSKPPKPQRTSSEHYVPTKSRPPSGGAAARNDRGLRILNPPTNHDGLSTVRAFRVMWAIKGPNVI